LAACRAFLWLDNVLADLNTLIPPGSPWCLQAALSINDAGEIVGYGSIDGDIHAFLATCPSPKPGRTVGFAAGLSDDPTRRPRLTTRRLSAARRLLPPD
jgi:hypothetical protein